jgi:hypothetical protein
MTAYRRLEGKPVKFYQVCRASDQYSVWSRRVLRHLNR